MLFLDGKLGDLLVRHVYREQNKVTDLLAKKDAMEKLFDRIRILIIPPVFFNNALCSEILACNSSSVDENS